MFDPCICCRNRLTKKKKTKKKKKKQKKKKTKRKKTKKKKTKKTKKKKKNTAFLASSLCRLLPTSLAKPTVSHMVSCNGQM